MFSLPGTVSVTIEDDSWRDANCRGSERQGLNM